MDAAAKPPWTGLRRPPQPDPPRHPTDSRLLLLLRLRHRQVQGAALPNTPLMLRRRMHSAEAACST
ncbi:hypothetical protein B9Y76_09195 [Stenotrophomonas maltophilia]|nr:hypothetical protein [Stenotrophomonas sp.]OWQ81258.1 hypothetical protein CEE62_08680 [Stenotrophomonas maltophilia]PJL02519.1 hypothetical protein B9Y76_09195 [Stenotrophomonas maltophilia]